MANPSHQANIATRASRAIGFALICFFILTAASFVRANTCSSSEPPASAGNTKAPARPEPRPSPTPINLGKQPLSKADLDKVMKWIAVQVSADRLPFCWKKSVTRKAEATLTECPSGTEKDGQLCYPTCEAGYKGLGPACWHTCPTGFTDIGGHCQKPAAYGRGAGYVIWDEQKCKNENPGGCEKNGALWYKKCKANFHAVGANICSPDCPTGWEDTGTGCTKPRYGRTAGTAMGCKEGLEKSGALCYKPCDNPNMTGVGPVCWDKCPSHLPVECAAGCAKTKGECINKVVDQIKAVVSAALSLASLGGGSGAKHLDELTDTLDAVTDLTSHMDGKIPIPVRPEGESVTGLAGSPLRPASDLSEKILYYAELFSDDFETLTTPEVASKIDSEFSEGAAKQIKKEWAVRHLLYTLELNGFKAAKDLMWLVSFGDPTGLSGVAEAFTNPKCSSNMEFPEVEELP